jgi:sugar O-acyltransferase (sialic acid O-acetyltransferase NeuD family)
MRPLVILGTGGNGLDILDIVEALNARAPCWRVAGHLDDAATGEGVLGTLADATSVAARWPDAAFVNAIGSERNHARRLDILARCRLPAERFAALVHPAASVSSRARLGPGACIGFGCSVAGRVEVAEHVWLGPGCVIGHDSVLAPGALLAPRATLAGHVRLGACAYVGSGALVRQNVTIGAGALVGMGAVVLRDVAPGAVVAGVPARVLRPA